HKTKPLQTLQPRNTPPTIHKLKQPIFNTLYHLSPLRLHLFPATAPLPIQPLSPPMHKIIFLHQNFKALNLIKPNLNQLHLISQPQLYKNNPHRPLKTLPKPQIQFHLI
ncbi:RsmD family RNA methyltransferase, partial [Staphylococcus epidermidis]|uniref:RsmD family RNA methyltransferase n=1 Tax=Staphylococcus epidermidis TaxID=1282 RepID=UPI0016429C8F